MSNPSIAKSREERTVNAFRLCLALMAVLPAIAGAAEKETLLREIGGRAAEREAAGERVLAGRDGWLFFVGELRSVSIGPFWGEAAAGVSRAARPALADPLPAIVEFHRQCEAAGVELILVPVPPKAVIYADRILEAAVPGPDGSPPRLDLHHQAFYRRLREEGVQVLDMTETFLRLRDADEGGLYCKHDTHWSSRACLLTAQAIRQKVAARPWVKSAVRRAIARYEAPLAIRGDLWGYIEKAKAEAETLPMIYAGTPRENQAIPAPVEPDRDSPVILMGDSHTLVFHVGGDLHARGAGLADHLALEFGFPVDLVGVRGAGTTVPRIDLARRRDNLKGKKLVIWCFSARQFTESVNGWMTGVPVVKTADQ